MQTICEKNHANNRSKKLFDKAQTIIPGGVNSPVRAFKAVDSIPRFIQAGYESFLVDIDEQHYIDYVCSWGAMILGHNHPAVLEAIQKTSEKGISFGAPSPLEVELAMEICSRIPSIEKIRMVNSGTEASMSAIRLARAATNRDKIIKFVGCYHGHVDCLLVEAGSGALTHGTPTSPGITKHAAKDTLVAEFNNLDSLEQIFLKHKNEIAAVIVEPIAGNMNLISPSPNFLPGLRQLCNQYQALLIFDEVMTGFRVGPTGAQGLYGIKPDLTTLGKIIGGGLPIGAFGGKAELMDLLSPEGPVYQAGTLSGNRIAMSAGLAVLRNLKEENYQKLSATSKQLSEGLKIRAQAANIPLFTNSCGGMWGFFFTQLEKINNYKEAISCNERHFIDFFNLMLGENIYLAPSRFETNFISLAHGHSEIEATLSAAEKAFSLLNKK